MTWVCPQDAITPVKRHTLLESTLTHSLQDVTELDVGRAIPLSRLAFDDSSVHSARSPQCMSANVHRIQNFTNKLETKHLPTELPTNQPRNLHAV